MHLYDEPFLFIMEIRKVILKKIYLDKMCKVFLGRDSPLKVKKEVFDRMKSKPYFILDNNLN
jgi:hypothetical protein